MKLDKLNRNMGHIARFSWMPVIDVKGRLKEFHCMNLRRVVKLPVMTHKEAEKKEIPYSEHGKKYVTLKTLVDLIMGDLEMSYDGLTRKVVAATRKWVATTLPKTKEIVKRQRTRCRNPVCRRGGTRRRKKSALFYPHESSFDPYCSKECMMQHLKKTGWKFVRDANGNLVKRYKKKCSKCGKFFWGPKTRKRCSACIKRQKL